MESEFDETVRNYCKLFKGDISRKTNFFKCEEFTSIDPLESILGDLGQIDLKREQKAINKNLLIKNGQWISSNEKDGEDRPEPQFLDLNPSNYK